MVGSVYVDGRRLLDQAVMLAEYPLGFTIRPDVRSIDVHLWLRERNMDFRYHAYPELTFFFKDKKEAMEFKLRWA